MCAAGRFFPDDPWAGPALNKTSLVRWGYRRAFIRSAHTALPRHANIAGSVTGALLHFKFRSRIQQKTSEESQRRQHTDEYKSYASIGQANMVAAQSSKYSGWQSLYRDGLICGIDWIRAQTSEQSAT